jgi:hypothetical protein
MFERYTERARRVLFFARYEASQLGSVTIETEHLLLGLLREGKGLTSRLFARANLPLQAIRQEIEGRTVGHEPVPTSVEIPFSAEAKRVLHYAADEADRLLHDYIGTEHLLLGILREERSTAATILAKHGLRLDGVRAEIKELLGRRAATREGPPDRDDPRLAPLDYTRFVPSEGVHLLHSQLSAAEARVSMGPRHWMMTGAELASVIARACDVDEVRVSIPVALHDGARFDVIVHLPREASQKELSEMVRKSLEAQFHVSISVEPRASGDVVVVRLAEAEGRPPLDA